MLFDIEKRLAEAIGRIDVSMEGQMIKETNTKWAAKPIMPSQMVFRLPSKIALPQSYAKVPSNGSLALF